MEIKRVFDILPKIKAIANKPDLIAGKENKVWVKHSTDDFINKSDYVAGALIDLGLKPGDVIAIMSNNRPEWNFVDYGAQKCGVVTAPIYPTINNEDLKYILNHSEAKAIFISDKNVYQKLLAIEEELPNLKTVVSFNQLENVPHFADFLIRGKNKLDLNLLQNIQDSISENDLLTLLYTSGTTGFPKGVMISHKNLLSNVIACQNFAPFSTSWKALSFLPLNHVYERFLNTLYFYHGVSVYYAESIETIGDNCKEIHPQIFVAVPRIFEKVYEKITAAGEKLTGFKRKMFDWSVKLAEQFELEGKNGSWYEFKRKILDGLVYSKWRAAIGGEIVCIVSGGAALNPRLERIFTCAGIRMLQGYGLTETCVVVAVNRLTKGDMMFGTVGLPVENIEVKIAEEDGEILMRGPSLMLGYYKNEAATKESIDKDGWFHTGDVGTMVDNKFLKITDRKKEIFKNSAGKYISPVQLENKLKESRFIEQCMVVGEGEKFVSALIIPNITNFREYCAGSGINWVSNEQMLTSDELKNLINDHVKAINKVLAPFEQLKRCEIIKANWTVDGGEITPKLSLKRKVILAKHKEVVDKIFSVS